MASITITPDPFQLVPYDSATVRALAEDAARVVGFPDGVDVTLEIDEVLPHPLTGTFVDVAGDPARIDMWMSGANFEDPKRPVKFQEELARAELVRAFLRAGDRLRPEFAGAPADEERSDRQRAAWDVWTEGRAARLGVPGTRPDRLRYHYRLQHGFNDVGDAVFDRLWDAAALSWTDLDAACAETAAADTRDRPKKTALRKEQLRARRPDATPA
jgi:hypothetical protein